MMADTPKKRLSLHPVGVVRAVGPEGSVADHKFVACKRLDESVPVDRCMRCEHKIAASYGAQGGPLSITCFDLAYPEPANGSHHGIELPRLTVGDVMTRNVLCVRPDLSLDAATELFIESGLKAVPVVDERGALLGILSESEVLLDIYAKGWASEPAGLEPNPGGATLGRTGAKTVADVMVPYAFTLPENAPVTRAAAVMAFEGTYRLTVLSAEGEVVGILSAADILYWLAKADGYVLPPPKHVKA